MAQGSLAPLGNQGPGPEWAVKGVMCEAGRKRQANRSVCRADVSNISSVLPGTLWGSEQQRGTGIQET